MDKIEKIRFFNSLANEWYKFKSRNRYYNKNIENLLKTLVPKNKKVIEIGSATGDLLNALQPSKGLGIDFSQNMVEIAKKKYKNLSFQPMDAENLKIKGKFDYVIASDLVGSLYDVEKSFREWHRVCHQHTKLVITYYNFLWAPLLVLAEKLHLKMPEIPHNWLSANDIHQLLYLADFEVIKSDSFLLFPKYVPLFSSFLNKYIARLPLVKRLCLVNYIVAKPITKERKEYSVSVIIPARNERGNIAPLVERTPKLGRHTEIIFIGGHSQDDTDEEIKRVIKRHPGKNIKFFLQDGIGKADAVRKGFDHAGGDILMILDADLSVAPEDLVKFYNAMVSGKGEFINGSRLVYPLEKQSMRFLNMLGNKFFSLMFSWILDTHIKDTLCGTKVIFAQDYQDIKANRHYFGNFDPFGDFDLLFGAAKLNLKIAELPVRYYARVYGETNISRWSHGWLLIKMTLFAMRKIKFF